MKPLYWKRIQIKEATPFPITVVPTPEISRYVVTSNFTNYKFSNTFERNYVLTE